MRKIVNFLLVISLSFISLCFNLSGCKKNEVVKPELRVNVSGGNNLISVVIEKNGSDAYEIYYSCKDEYQKIDENLILESDNAIKAEILGLKKGIYSVEIDTIHGDARTRYTYNDIEVGDIDRSGYAHFNNENGVGAYNDDGTLKDDALVIYLTDENKNDLTANFNGRIFRGIVNILSNLNLSLVPVAIRVKGSVETNQWKSKNLPPRLSDDSNLTDDYFKNEYETTVKENIVGLKNNVIDAKDGLTYQYVTTKTGIDHINTSTNSYKGAVKKYNGNDYPDIKGKQVYADDCSYNCVAVKNAKNVTIEGVFDDARIYQWGISFRDCNSIEIKNLTFDSYTEDAIGFYSSTYQSQRIYPFSNFFVTHCTFNSGRNNWDVTGERDKYKGDGSVDLNQVSNVTISYSKFLNCKKTTLISSSEECFTKNVTMHHNYYYKCESRLPLTRHSNIHTYNNYFDNCNSCITAGANAYVFSENNYFYNSKRVAVVTSYQSYTGSRIKSFNDIFVGCFGDASTKVSERELPVDNSCDVETTVDYTTFDVNEDIFYYDGKNKKSDVSILTETNSVPDFVVNYSGILGKYKKLL